MNIGSVPQRAGLEIRLVLPLCSCNDNHDVRQTVIDIDLLSKVLAQKTETWARIKMVLIVIEV